MADFPSILPRRFVFGQCGGKGMSQRLERAGVCVEGERQAERNHLVFQSVSEREIRDDRKPEGFRGFHDHSPNLVAIAASLETSENQSSQTLQDSSQFQVKQEPVQAIKGFIAVFHEEQSSRQVGQIGGAEEMGEAREVSPHEGARGAAPSEDLELAEVP